MGLKESTSIWVEILVGGKVAYSWISQDPVKAGPTLGVVVVVTMSYDNLLIDQ